MRFILNFFFFGFIFYLIYLYFPEAFHTLTSWAQSVLDFLKEIFTGVVDKISHSASNTAPPVTK
jgi:hypothetical protein